MPQIGHLHGSHAGGQKGDYWALKMEFANTPLLVFNALGRREDNTDLCLCGILFKQFLGLSLDEFPFSPPLTPPLRALMPHNQRAPNPPELAQPGLCSRKGGHPHRGRTNLGVLFLYGRPYSRVRVQILVCLICSRFDLPRWGCANLGGFGASLALNAEISSFKLEKKKTMTMTKIASQKTCYTYGHGPLKTCS